MKRPQILKALDGVSEGCKMNQETSKNKFKNHGINIGDLFYLNQVNSAYSWTSDEYFEWYQNRNSWGGILSKSHAPTILYIDKGIFIYIGLKEKLIYKKDIYCHFYDILSKKNIYYYAVNINNFFKLCA